MDPNKRPEGLDHPIVPKIIKLMSRANVWLYRRTNGWLGGTWRIGPAWPHGRPLLLLTTLGRKSGRARTTPLLYLADGEHVIIVASQGGLPSHPQWYHNVLAQPDVEVQRGKRKQRMRAREATSDERAGLWPKLVAYYSDFATYQAWTDRLIPVVILEPLPS